jgi:hypothetical protein
MALVVERLAQKQEPMPTFVDEPMKTIDVVQVTRLLLPRFYKRDQTNVHKTSNELFFEPSHQSKSLKTNSTFDCNHDTL